MRDFTKRYVRSFRYIQNMETAIINNRSAIEAWQRGFAGVALPVPGDASITCISNGTQLGILKAAMPDLSMPISILATNRNSRSKSNDWDCHVWSRPLLPHAVYLLNEAGVSVSAPWFCFMQMTSCMNLPDAIRLGMELCGSHSTLPFTPGIHAPYSLSEREKKNGFVECPAICTAHQLRQALQETGASSRSNAVKAARYVVDGSRSPGESRLYIMLCLPPRYGGYGLPRPKLNTRIDLPPSLRKIVGAPYYICDLYYPGAGLAIEYDGCYHWEGERRMNDNMRQLILNELGIEVFRVDRLQLENQTALDIQARNIAKRLGVRMRAPNETCLKRRSELRAQVLNWNVHLYR